MKPEHSALNAKQAVQVELIEKLIGVLKETLELCERALAERKVQEDFGSREHRGQER